MTNQERLGKDLDFMFAVIDTWCYGKNPDCIYCRFYDEEKDKCIFEEDERETKAEKIIKWLKSEESK